MLETPVLTFSLVYVRGWRGRECGHGFAPDKLTADIARDGIKVKHRVIYPSGGYIIDVKFNPPERFVGQIFRLPTTTASEDFDQTTADLLITLPGLFPIGMKPREQVIKRFGWCWKPFIPHFKPAGFGFTRRLLPNVVTQVIDRKNWIPLLNKDTL